MEQEREVVTACLEQTQQVVEQAREEMRANIEQVQQVVERERAHLEMEGAELRRQKEVLNNSINRGRTFDKVHTCTLHVCEYYLAKQ